MNRRAVLAMLGGSAVALPWGARAQLGPASSAARTKLIGALLLGTAGDLESLARIDALESGLAERGWIKGRNLEIAYRWGASSEALFQGYAAELIGKAPDVLLSQSGGLATLRDMTGTIPIVFVNIPDPVEQGLVTSLARPGGTITGFSGIESSIVGRALQTLKEIVPAVARVAVLGNPSNNFEGYYRAAREAAARLQLDAQSFIVRDEDDIAAAIGSIVSMPGAGLLVSASPANLVHRAAIINLAARHRLPAIYPYEFYVRSGGLLSYGIDVADLFRRSASYIDRILRGERAGDLPVQQPEKYHLAINLATAKELGLAIPQSLLARADEVIE